MIARLLCAGAVLAVAGCNNLPESSLGGTFVTEPFVNESIAVSDFNSALAEAYRVAAEDAAHNDVNWYDASAYARKGWSALDGQSVQAWTPAELGISDPAVASLHADAIAKISANKGTNPIPCARAQVALDNYLEEVSEDYHSITDPEVAKATLIKHLAECSPTYASEAPVSKEPTKPKVAAQQDRFVVYFGFDRSDLTAAARQTIGDVLATLKSLSNPLISVVGHTDRVGSVSYNQGLSERRANSVTQALTSGNVSMESITKSGRSELETAIPTADGVREPKNRRVEITISR